MESNIQGSCHCGDVSFQVAGKPRVVLNCHCDDCKRRNGGAFSTYMVVAESDLHISNSDRSLASYSVEGKGEKYFCTRCGTPIYNKNERYPGLYMVFYGAIKDQNQINPMFNVYCESMAEWVSDLGKLKSFEREIER